MTQIRLDTALCTEQTCWIKIEFQQHRVLLPLSVCLAGFMCGTNVLDKDGVSAAPVLLPLPMCSAGFMCGTNVLDKDGVSAAPFFFTFANVFGRFHVRDKHAG